MSLQIQDLSKAFSVRTLFRGVSFAVPPGERIALVGRNGSGKTTLMRIILGQETADTGRVVRPRDARIGYLPQEIFLAQDAAWNAERATATLWDLATQAFAPLFKLQDEIRQAEARLAAEPQVHAHQERLDVLQTRFQDEGGFTWQARTVRVLKGLGFPEARFHDPLREFSGGWQMRAYFARLLLTEPDFLLLDEPTNYLDIASIAFLEEYLGDYRGGMLIVSHDRYFLDRLATSVVALLPDGARTYRGNYSQFLEALDSWIAEAEAAKERQDKERRRITRFIERFRYKNTKASQVQSRIKMLEKWDEVQTFQAERGIDFTFPPCPASGETVLTAENLNRSYGDHHVLRDVGFTLCRGDRLAIIGENGTGKSTLMRILAGTDPRFTGRLEPGFRVQQGYFAQDEEISFEGEETVWQRMLRDCPFDMVPQLRNLLGAFLFSGDDVERPVRVLSGGEKSRLGLARLMLRPFNLLLMDEPTNHLDISSREALLQALDAFPGTLILVSHDRFFLDCLATRILALRDSRVIAYEGNYSQYLWACQHGTLQAVAEATADRRGGNGDGEGADDREAQESWKERKRQSNQRQRWERDIASVETEITRLEQEIGQIERELASPAPGCTPAHLTQLSSRHQAVTGELARSMERWEALHQMLDAGGPAAAREDQPR
ncbi:MAG: ABC-F family ATP-binding cassette domain-containing protein [Candidatus Riflebacteria bacterium]|nr:ABC-F family ATP-binding cassette domain-containing protein [Candidatus Riflebacteria bacterium]